MGSQPNPHPHLRGVSGRLRDTRGCAPTPQPRQANSNERTRRPHSGLLRRFGVGRQKLQLVWSSLLPPCHRTSSDVTQVGAHALRPNGCRPKAPKAPPKHTGACMNGSRASAVRSVAASGMGGAMRCCAWPTPPPRPPKSLNRAFAQPHTANLATLPLQLGRAVLVGYGMPFPARHTDIGRITPLCGVSISRKALQSTPSAPSCLSSPCHRHLHRRVLWIVLVAFSEDSVLAAVIADTRASTTGLLCRPPR